MSKGIIGGMTDYIHQFFEDIITDVESEKKNTIHFVDIIKANTSKENLYWSNSVPNIFKNIVAYSSKHYETVITEFDDIMKDLKYEVKEHHIKRLKNISQVAGEININIGKIWHQDYQNKEYEKPEFRL